MNTIVPLLLFVIASTCFAAEGTSILALSDWSASVTNAQGQTVRARVVLAQGRSAGFAGSWPETQFYLEFQNVSAAAGPPIQFFFDPSKNLKCELRDADGKSPSHAGGGSGGGPEPAWITLPYDSSICLRANMYGYGKEPGNGLLLCLWPPNQYWNIPAGDTNLYFLSGTFALISRTNPPAQWSSPLHLPTLKISVQKSSSSK